MPNPFPGMDPFLEGESWSIVHSNLIEEIARQLAGKLWPKYLVLSNKRTVLALPELDEVAVRVPDVGVFDSTSSGWHATTGTQTLTAPIVMNAIVPRRQPQKFIEIRDVQKRRLVTIIEVLSPTKWGDGMKEYRKKRRQLLMKPVHLVEIDLLRAGKRFPVSGKLPSLPYFVCISRVNRRPKVEIWPIALDQGLPEVPIPLRKVDPDAVLDLQTAFQTVYDLYHYEVVADHSRELSVPLSDEQMSWVRERLQSVKLNV